ncbi:MAG TPA: MBL fold metallo-hydrolase [Syntrophales bacterium]|nr:MBL fold metallo-hydrolase [Syntrophales bacterium]
MNIKWYGHAAFKITTGGGTRIIIDPYQAGFSGGALSYGSITDEADIVITSHDHGDHNYVKSVQGDYVHIKTANDFTIRNVKMRLFPSFHDTSKGKERGNNLISVINADELTLAHLGDLGHELPQDAIKEMGPVDILLLPVGGFYTIDAAAATKVMNDINSKITIPMHYRTEKCSFPITTVQEFTKGKKNVRTMRESELAVTKESLPEEPEIVVLQHAL